MAHSALARAQAIQARHRQHIKTFERGLIRKASVSLAAGSLGTIKRMGVKDDLHGFPWKLGLWLGATVGEALSRGALMQAFCAGVSDATMAIYIENAIVTKSLVAGDEI